jgi:hypothetical protein
MANKRVQFIVGGIVSFGFLFILFQNFSPTNSISAPQCSSLKMNEILSAPVALNKTDVNVDCSFTLSGSEIIKKNLVIEGAQASGVKIDCNGASIDVSQNQNPVAILVSSVSSKGNSIWSAPTQVEVTNCKIKGSIRTMGMAKNGEGALLRDSSRLDANHTQRAQQNAPSNISFTKLSIETVDSIPLYIGPGSTKIRLKNSLIKGRSESAAIYMDAESASNQILNNTFEIVSKVRELIAIDGSANNVISGNEFKNLDTGGIYIYRNCGEGGTIRHQKPTGNLISKNRFYHQDLESINVGSRKGNSVYCSYDSGYPFGSSVDDNDFADNTTIADNIFYVNFKRKSFLSRFVISSSSPSTTLTNNKIITTSQTKFDFNARVFGKFVDGSGNMIEVK